MAGTGSNGEANDQVAARRRSGARIVNTPGLPADKLMIPSFSPTKSEVLEWGYQSATQSSSHIGDRATNNDGSEFRLLNRDFDDRDTIIH
jgi:hypothetical protein